PPPIPPRPSGRRRAGGPGRIARPTADRGPPRSARDASPEDPTPMASPKRPVPPRKRPARALGAAVALTGLFLYQSGGLDASGPIRSQDPAPATPDDVGNVPDTAPEAPTEAPDDPDVSPAVAEMDE